MKTKLSKKQDLEKASTGRSNLSERKLKRRKSNTKHAASQKLTTALDGNKLTIAANAFKEKVQNVFHSVDEISIENRVKTKFIDELSISNEVMEGSISNDVKKVQEWLCYHSIINENAALDTSIDGSFGTSTKKCVENFQSLSGLNVTGIVDTNTFKALCQPLFDAFNYSSNETSLQKLVCEIAEHHLSFTPIEIPLVGNNNTGPWVRAYSDGAEGTDMPWCVAFIQSIFDQASALLNYKYTTIMPITNSCDVLGNYAISEKKLITNSELRADLTRVKQGDIFLCEETAGDWTHVGIVINVQGSILETIEGNTNEDGSRNGIGVFRRNRDLNTSNIDIFSVQQ